MCSSSKQTVKSYINQLKIPSNLLPSELGNLYFYSCFIQASCDFLIEEKWLMGLDAKKKPDQDFLKQYFNNQLSTIDFIKDDLCLDNKALLKLKKQFEKLEFEILLEAKERTPVEKKKFLIQALNRMTNIFIQEEQAREDNLNFPRLYRSFDGLDSIFELDYNLDVEMLVDEESKERLYQGSGVGVQSGYSSILLALHFLDLKYGQSVTDLGSGYGRLGLVFSLLRSDLLMNSYEYVDHRVQLSKEAASMLEISKKCIFTTQDLSVEDFKLPFSDIYYLYDPFSEETYQYIISQISEYAKSRKVTIVTKGNARKWFLKLAKEKSWKEPLDIDASNLSIFELTT
tara:strand:+ start:226030 stop:227058 length:1029 start_codon:yes stop_codon:yes gene_type:complete